MVTACPSRCNLPRPLLLGLQHVSLNQAPSVAYANSCELTPSSVQLVAFLYHSQGSGKPYQGLFASGWIAPGFTLAINSA